MKRSSFLPILFTLTALVVLTVVTPAQTEKGSIVGNVVDGNGAAVANASVALRNTATNTTQTFVTNGEGNYSAPFLDPGTYEVTVTASGFARSVVSDVIVSVGTPQSVTVTLKIGDVSETVQVQDAAPLIQTENANVGQLITSQQLSDLPSANRNIYQFLAVDSTVNGIGVNSSNAEAFRVESGGTMSINGSRPSSITFKIDGQANNDPTFGTPAITPSLETVKEFQLQNNAYSAEFEGLTQVNVATKSGGSKFHGSVFDFLQNDWFQPRNPNAPLDSKGRRGKNKLRYNQFGGSIGGPVWVPRFGDGGGSFWDKDSTFFFFSYEGLRNNGRALGFGRVLTQAERTGDFSASLGACILSGTTPVPQLNPDGTPSGNCVRVGQIFDPLTTVANPLFIPGTQTPLNPQFIRQPFANNRIPAERISATARALIDIQQPLPNFVSASDLNFAGPAGNNFVNNQYSIRIDHRFSDTDSMHGRYTWQNNSRDGEAILPFQQKDLIGRGRVFNSSWTHIFTPNFINELRVGYINAQYGDSITEVDPTQFGIGNTDLNTLPGIFLTSGGQLTYGGFTASVLETTQNTFQISDNFSLTRGRHFLKFGFKADHNKFVNVDKIQSNGLLQFNGLFSSANSGLASTTFGRPNSIADFLLGNVSSQNLNVARPARLQSMPYAFYFQDDWRIHDRLTINLGVRYEIHQPFKEEGLGGRRIDLEGEGVLRVADPAIAQLANSPLVVCCTDERVVDTDMNDIGPRIGIAYQPFKGASTVIRAGFGKFFTDTSQFFHWLYYQPIRGGSYTPTLSSFTTPSALLSNPFPSSQFTPPGSSGISITTPAGANQPVVSISALGPYKTPESYQWSVGVQHEVLKNMVLDVSYKGSKSKNLPVQWFFNQPTFSNTQINLASSDPAANPWLRRPYDNFSIGSNIVANVLESEYNALTVKVDKRFADGYGFLSTYTWSRSTDQGAEVYTLGQNHAFLANNLDFDAGRGVSIFDIPHRWVTSGTYEIPFGRGKWLLDKGGIVNALLGGWRLSGIFTIQSGQPFSPYLLTAASHTNTGVSVVERGNFGNTAPWTDEEWEAALDAWQQGARLYIIRPDAIDLNYTGIGNVPRNAFRYLYTRRLDLSLAKVTRFGEAATVELRFDMFNVTREVLHNPVFHTQVAGANALTQVIGSPPMPTRGSIPGRNIFFLPHTIQVGARITF